MVENMLEGTEVRLNVDYLADRETLNALADKVVYTGPVDAYFDYRLGALQYRSVRFETEVLDPLHPHHRAQALRVRHPAQNGHQP